MKFTTKTWVQTQFQNFANRITSVFAKKTDIPTVGNGTLTIQKNGTNVQTFTANQSGNVTANITTPTNAADVGAVPTSKVLTTKEQVNANTDASNVASAVAVKNMIGEINSDLVNLNYRNYISSFEDNYTLIPYIGYYDNDTINSPSNKGISYAGYGVAIISQAGIFRTALAIPAGSTELFVSSNGGNNWAKANLLNI